jgi:hypothetical protein
MAADRFHLAWFLQGSSIQAWAEPWTGNISEEWMTADLFLDLARNIERARFDYLSPSSPNSGARGTPAPSSPTARPAC